MHLAQHELSEIPTADFLLVEESQSSCRPNSRRDRAAAAARAPLLFPLADRPRGERCARTRRHSAAEQRCAAATPSPRRTTTASCSPSRRGSASPRQSFRACSTRAGFETELKHSLAQSEMLKYHFRNAAQTGLMVYRNFFDQQKPMRKLAWSCGGDFQRAAAARTRSRAPARGAARHAARVSRCRGALAFLDAQAQRPVRLRRVERVPPLSFAMYATKIKEALLVEDPYETLERLYHQWWSEIEESRRSGFSNADADS